MWFDLFIPLVGVLWECIRKGWSPLLLPPVCCYLGRNTVKSRGRQNSPARMPCLCSSCRPLLYTDIKIIVCRDALKAPVTEVCSDLHRKSILLCHIHQRKCPAPKCRIRRCSGPKQAMGEETQGLQGGFQHLQRRRWALTVPQHRVMCFAKWGNFTRGYLFLWFRNSKFYRINFRPEFLFWI